jgi:hypothetical protein
VKIRKDENHQNAHNKDVLCKTIISITFNNNSIAFDAIIPLKKYSLK